MNLTDKSKELVWNWNGIPTKLKDLTDGQLHSIKQSINKSKNNWFGQSKDYWLNAINPVLKQREASNINQIVQRKELNRTTEAIKGANLIIQTFKNQKS